MFEVDGKVQKGLFLFSLALSIVSGNLFRISKQSEIRNFVWWIDLFLLVLTVVALIYVKLNTEKNDEGKRKFPAFWMIIPCITNIFSLIVFIL